MAFKLIRRANVVTAANTADDAQHTVDLGKLNPGAAFRVSEFGGQDVFFKITNEGTAVTSTNGIFLRAGQSVIVVPEERPKHAFATSATNANPCVLTFAGGHSFEAGDQISITESTSAFNTLITDANCASVDETTVTTDKNSTSTGSFTAATVRSNFKISVINETGGSDGAVYIEEVVQVHGGL